MTAPPVTMVPASTPVSSAPLISVVVTGDEHSRFFREAVDSIGSPALPVETIVIGIARDAEAERPVARNRGLRESQAEYIVFLDASDKLAPGALELGAAQLEEHPEAAFVFGRCLPMDPDGTLRPAPATPRIIRGHYRELLRWNFIGMSGIVMFRREALLRVGGFNELLTASADYELYLHIARHHPVHDHGQVVAFCRSAPAPSKGTAPRVLAETLDVLRSQRPFLEADPASLEAYAQGWTMWQEYYAPMVVEEIRAAVNTRDWTSVVRDLAALGRHHPRALWHHARRLTRLPHRYGGRAMPAGEA